MTPRTCHEDVFAIVRIDHWPGARREPDERDGPDIAFGEYSVTIKEIVRGIDVAQAEVARLNALNAEKGCRYYWQGTRHFPDGGSFGSSP